LHVKPGDYIVAEVLQDKWYQSYPKKDVLKNFHPDDLGEKGYAESVKSGQKVDDLDFGNYQKRNRGDKDYDLKYDA